jgi:4-hydroxy-tetrahydrodipicolinate reductase
MKIALTGTGSMGQAVERLAAARGDVVTARFNTDNPLADVHSRDALQGADVVIDFSLPFLMGDHLERYCALDMHVVIGTTGWYDQVDNLRERTRHCEAGIIYAPNFSLGVALLRHAVREVANLVNRLPEYDVSVHESHHIRKADSPSGTALWLADTLVDRIDRKKVVETETQHGRIDPSRLHVTSNRVGSVVGEHTVSFDSAFDQVRLVHEARNRDGFAFGALKAAEWVKDKKGLYTLDDMFSDWIGRG